MVRVSLRRGKGLSTASKGLGRKADGAWGVEWSGGGGEGWDCEGGDGEEEERGRVVRVLFCPGEMLVRLRVRSEFGYVQFNDVCKSNSNMVKSMVCTSRIQKC